VSATGPGDLGDGKLRRKLDDPADSHLILTEPGMGYRLAGG
jgi:DNA-binding response OmpR family regulator